MAKKIMVSQSTSGDVPESGLDVLNHRRSQESGFTAAR